jgi:hypothetical protein
MKNPERHALRFVPKLMRVIRGDALAQSELQGAAAFWRSSRLMGVPSALR